MHYNISAVGLCATKATVWEYSHAVLIIMRGNAMIILRQGKAKSILENSINSALTAVETYNRPRVQFRTENYIILMIIAWTKLFHA